MTTAVQPRVSSNRRRAALAALVLGALAVAAVPAWNVYRAAADGKLLRAAVAALDAADPHWRLEEIEQRRAHVPDAQNSARLIQKARALLPAPTPQDRQRSADLYEALNRLDSNVLLTDEQYHAAVEALEDAEAAVSVARRLAEYPRGRHAINYTKDGISTLLRHTDDINQIDGSVLRFLLAVHAHEGDAAAAVRDSLCLLNLGRSMGDEPFLISQIFRANRGAHAAARGLERALGQGDAPDAELARLQAALADESRHDPWVLALRGDRASVHRMMQAVADGSLKLSWLRGIPPPGRPATVAGRVGAWFDDRFPPDVARAHAWLLEHYTRLIDETGPLPWHERSAAVDRVAADTDTAPELARFGFINGSRTLHGLQNGQAAARCGTVALAVERYRMRTGHWPVALNALPPDLLAAVPMDPYDGRPVRYRRLADGVVVYCVGVDRTDNGGPPMSPGTGNGDDAGVRLWDVAQRRQPPPAEVPP